jgi:hypothetical protein
MRCKICNTIDAEYFDSRDDTYLCNSCKEDIDRLIFEQDQDNSENEDTPDLS